MTGNGRSLIDEQERGFIKILAHKDTDVILGAQLMCSAQPIWFPSSPPRL